MTNSKLNDFFKELFITEIVEKLITDTKYKEQILEESSLYYKMIEILTDGIKIYEFQEDYEICSLIKNFKSILINKATEKLEKIKY